MTLGPGVHTITLTVDDGRGGMDSDTVEITVNQAPIANAGPDQVVTVAPGDTAMVTLDGSGSSDPDGDPLSFTWTNSFGTAMGVMPTVTLAPGVYTITLTVDDGNGGMGSDTVEVTVNQAPIADAGPDQLVTVAPGDSAMVTLDGSGSSDLDGDPLTFTWTNAFGAVMGATPTVTLGPGVHTITLTVDDGRGGMDSDTVEITVNQAPIADAGLDQKVSTRDNDRVRVTLDGSASSDADGDPLTFTWTGSFGTLAGVVVNPVLKPGTHNITLTVEDGKGGVASDRMTVVVTDGRPPKLTASPRELSFSLEQGAEPASQPFTLRVERGPVNYTIRTGGSWLRANPDRGRITDGEEHRILAVVDPRPAVGTHTAPLFIRSSQAAIRVLVTLVITPGSGVLPPEQPKPAVSEHAVVNAASLIPFGSPGHPVAQGSMVSIFGSNFTDGEHFEAENIPLPFTLGGVSVTFNGLPAALYGVWPDQINAQLSWGLTGSALQPLNAQLGSQQVTSTATLVVQNANGSSDPSVIEINTFSPAIFTTSATGAGQGTVFFANTLDLVAPAGFLGNSRPANAEAILTIYANGLGPVDPPIEDGYNSCGPGGDCLPDFSNLVLRSTTTRPVITIGGVLVPDENVLFSGLSPQNVALYQVDIRAPQGLPSGDAVPIVIRMGGVESQGDVTIAVE